MHLKNLYESTPPEAAVIGAKNMIAIVYNDLYFRHIMHQRINER